MPPTFVKQQKIRAVFRISSQSFANYHQQLTALYLSLFFASTVHLKGPLTSKKKMEQAKQAYGTNP